MGHVQIYQQSQKEILQCTPVDYIQENPKGYLHLCIQKRTSAETVALKRPYNTNVFLLKKKH